MYSLIIFAKDYAKDPTHTSGLKGPEVRAPEIGIVFDSFCRLNQTVTSNQEQLQPVGHSLDAYIFKNSNQGSFLHIHFSMY